MIYLGVFAAILYTAVAQQNPTITYITKERVVDIGGTVDLDCSVQYAADYSVLWVKLNPDDPSNVIFISSGSQTVLPDQRFSIRHDEASQTYTLQITKIQEIDAAIYQCQVLIGTSNKITADVWVHVRISPVIADNSTRSVLVGIGDNATLECYAHGYPRPRISWRRENNELLPTGGAAYYGNVLKIFNVSKNDRGTYYCVADNGVGHGARRNIGVEVEFAPVVTADRFRYGQALQNPVDLQCHVEAFPQTSVEWFKDDKVIIDNQDYRQSISITEDEFTDATLSLSRITAKQYGKYTCVAKNKLGRGEETIELYETPHPVCPPACDMAYTPGAASYISTKWISAILPFIIVTVM